MNSTRRPSFTVFVPSYNGGAYLRECVAGILAQSYDSFELAVLDDGSTDGSLEWLQSLQDSRLKLYPSQHLGIIDNWRRTLIVPKLDYLTIVGQDDRLDANYLQVMADLIDKFPDAGLYHAHFRFIDGKGRLLRHCRPLPERETAADYVRALFTANRDTYGTGYLMPSKRYEEAGGIPPFDRLLFADDALWVTMMHGSYKAIALEECVSCRLHSASTSAGPPWRSWLNAMEPYSQRLNELAADDPDLRDALAETAPDYFLRYAQSVCDLAIVQATKRNLPADPRVMDDLAAVIERIAPSRLNEFQRYSNSRRYQLRRLINTNIIARAVYHLYIRLRHRRSGH